MTEHTESVLGWSLGWVVLLGILGLVGYSIYALAGTPERLCLNRGNPAIECRPLVEAYVAGGGGEAF